MLTHPRYGMGKRLGAADVDKWALYVIGHYCDQSVPDGFGSTRITCNAADHTAQGVGCAQ